MSQKTDEISSILKEQIKNYDVDYLTYDDVVQFSNIEDCTTNLCRVVKSNGDSGFGYVDIGKLLEDDGKERNDGAYRKYGENQVKTGEQLGLVHIIDATCFLMPFGYVYNDLDENQKKLLLARMILRNKLVKRLIYRSVVDKKSSYKRETGFLKESTQTRRRANVKRLFDFLYSSEECDLSVYFDNIVFD